MAPDEAQSCRSNDRGGWRQEKERPGQRQTPGALTGLPDSQRAGKPGLAMPGGQKRWCRAANIPGAVPTLSRASETCGAPQRLKEAQGEGRNTEALLEIEHHLPQPEGESREGESRPSSERAVSGPETSQGLTLRSRRVTSIAPRPCKPPNSSESDAAVLADAGRRNRYCFLRSAAPAPRCQLLSLPPRRCSNHCLGKWLFYEWEGREL